MPTLLLLVSTALGADIGSTDLVHSFNAQTQSARTISMTADDGDVWVAVEFTDSSGDPDVELFLVGSSPDHKTLSSGRMTNSGFAHYPTVVAPDGDDFVYVAAKEDQTNTHQNVETFRQDRDDLTVASSTSDLGTVPADIKHGRAHIAFDASAGSSTDQLALCWTRTDMSATTPHEDTFQKAKDLTETWSSASVHPVAQTTGDDDHCEQDFSHEGDFFTIYHSDDSGDDLVRVNIDSFNTSTEAYTSVADFALTLPTGHDDVDFPTISLGAGSVLTNMVASAQSLTDNTDVLIWSCDDSTSDCDTAGEWSSQVIAAAASGTAKQPQAATGGNARFVFVEDTGNSVIQLFGRCSSETTFSYKGTLESATGYGNKKQTFSSIPGKAMSTAAFDGIGGSATLHAVFLQKPNVGSRYDAMHWSETISTLCP